MKNSQLSMFDLADKLKREAKTERYMKRYGPKEQARDRGMELVYQHANTDWKRAAAKQLQAVLKSHTTFTSDDILIPLEEQGIVTGDTRALAAILVGARKAGLINTTDNFVPTRRPSRHKAPVRVWRVLTGGV